MTSGDSRKDGRFWRDFAHTLTVDMASALAARDIASGRTTGRTRTFTLHLKAAAGGQGYVLPATEQLTSDGMIGLRFERNDGGITIHLQLKGFAAISNFGNCPARIVSDDRVIAIEVVFDRHGSASCVVADEPRTLEALRTLRVFIELEV